MSAPGRLRSFIRTKVLRRPPRASYTDPRGAWTLLEKSSRSVKPRGLVAGSRESQGLWVPITRPEGLVLLTDLVWILGAGVDRVVEETTKGGWDFEPLFQAKCLACGAEYDVVPEEGDLCDAPGCFSANFREPDPQQLEGGGIGDGGILALIERPNWDKRTGRVTRGFKDLLKDAVHYSNVIGWWNWEVTYDAMGRPAQLWSMNSESMRRVDDPGLALPGSWFCPVCHGEEEDIDQIFHPASSGEESPTCPEHGILLLRPEWVQLGEGDKIVAVWAVHEVLSDMPRARGNRIYPRSKVHRVWALGQTMRWTERFDLAALSGQRAPDAMVTVEGRTQAEVNKMLQKWEDFNKDNPEYDGVIWIGLGPEAGNVAVHHFLGDLINRDFIAWGESAMKAVAMNLGVSFVFVGGQEAGKLGKSEEQLTVSYDTIGENQSQTEEFVNGKLVPLYPEVQDWRFAMKPPAPEDLEEAASEAIAWFNAIRVAREAGADAKLDPQAPFDWPIIIEGWQDRAEVSEETVPEPPGEPEEPPLPIEESRNLGGPEPGRPVEKGLSARGIPRKEAIAGIRKLEDVLAGKLRIRLAKAARDFKRIAGKSPSEVELRRLTADVAVGLQEEFARLGGQYVGRAYRLGLEEEKAVTPEASFEGRDRTEVRRLQDDPEFLKGRLSKVVEDATGVISEEIRASLEEGESTLVAAQRAADMLDEEAWKVERIVRSDTTNVANAGRMTQFEKHGRPGDEYGFASAADERRCPICKAADEGVKTLAAEERAEVERAGYDPELLHGNPYTLLEVKALWQAHKSFHGNCRCTVRRHVALT
ncbi:MAG: phage minor head protein [bacterium]